MAPLPPPNAQRACVHRPRRAAATLVCVRCRRQEGSNECARSLAWQIHRDDQVVLWGEEELVVRARRVVVLQRHVARRRPGHRVEPRGPQALRSRTNACGTHIPFGGQGRWRVGVGGVEGPAEVRPADRAGCSPTSPASNCARALSGGYPRDATPCHPQCRSSRVQMPCTASAWGSAVRVGVSHAHASAALTSTVIPGACPHTVASIVTDVMLTGLSFTTKSLPAGQQHPTL